MTKRLIVNADDLGIARPVNLAIGRGFREGIVSSASLLVNMPAVGHAIEEVIRPNSALGIGVHLCVTSGPPVLPAERIPLSVDARKNCFHRGFVGLWRLLHTADRQAVLDQIRDEWAAQIGRAEALGVAIDHLDSHQHVHMIPELFELAVRLAAPRKLAVRISGEALRFGRRGPIGLLACLANGGLMKWAVLRRFARTIRRNWPETPSTDHYFGVLDTGRMTLVRLRNILRSLPEGVSEITVHPSLASADPVLAPAATPGSGVSSPHPLGEGPRTSSPLPLGEGPRTSSPLPLGEGPGVRANPVGWGAAPASHPEIAVAGASAPAYGRDASGVHASVQDQRFLRRRQASEELTAMVGPLLRELLASQGVRRIRFRGHSIRPRAAGLNVRPSDGHQFQGLRVLEIVEPREKRLDDRRGRSADPTRER